MMPMVDALVPEFDHEMTTTRKLLERVPEDRMDWKPHPKSYTLGQLAQHVATIPMWGGMTMTLTELDMGGVSQPPPMRTRAELLAAFDENAAATRGALTGRTDAELLVPWTLKSHGQALFSMPRAAVWRGFVLSHLIHHRGQLSVYLRMQDVPLPSIYGPSADESPF